MNETSLEFLLVATIAAVIAIAVAAVIAITIVIVIHWFELGRAGIRESHNLRSWRPYFGADLSHTYKCLWLGWWLIIWCWDADYYGDIWPHDVSVGWYTYGD